MPVLLHEHRFDALDQLKRYRDSNLSTTQHGACANFIGSMRDLNVGQKIESMFLEHYPGMTLSFLEELCERTTKKFTLIDCLVVHRYGHIQPGDDIVLTAAWSAHRAEAFDACRYLMEELKARAPFWKQETSNGKSHWVHDLTTR